MVDTDEFLLLSANDGLLEGLGVMLEETSGLLQSRQSLQVLVSNQRKLQTPSEVVHRHGCN